LPRKRMIDPEFWSDEEIGQWSFEARLFYIGLWNFSDDEGRFKAHNSLLKSQIFPYEQRINIGKLKQELNHKVQWYDVDGLQYGHLCNFLKHQRIDRPQTSKLPIPPPFDEQSSNARRVVLPNIREVKLSKEKITTTMGNNPQAEEVFEAWNKTAISMPVKILNKTRKDKIGARLKEQAFMDNYLKIFELVEASDFLTGRAPSKEHPNFKGGLDWIITNDHNYIKVLEGKYDNKKVSDIERFLK